MISHAHKVIFVHIPKTAGQSVEQAFLDDLGLEWSQRAPLLLRLNYDRRIGPAALSHLYAEEYVRLGHITQADFDSYFKFAVVRNPYDRLLSEYRYRTFWQTGPLPFFLRRRYRSDYSDNARHVIPQARYVQGADGALLVDQIVKFEDLAEEMPPLFEKMLGKRMALPKRNHSHRAARRLSRDQLKPSDKKLIYEMFKDDFELFGYDPEL